jgi:hypothetical protein
METVATLDEKINEIRESAKYQNLIIKHRGPQEVAALRDLMMRINAYEQQKLMLLQTENFNAQLAQSQEHGMKILSAPKSTQKNTVVKAKPKRMTQPFHTDIALPDVPPIVEKPPPVKNITPFTQPGRGAAKLPQGLKPQVLTAVPNTMPNAQRRGTAPPPPVYPIVREEKRFTTVGKSIKKIAVVKAKPPAIVSYSTNITAAPKQNERAEGAEPVNIDNILNEINDLEYSDSDENLIGDYDDI